MNPQLSLSSTRMQAGNLRPRGPVIVAGADSARPVVRLLHEAKAISQAVASRCERQYLAGLRRRSPPLAAAALEHGNDAREHAERIAGRIAELGGEQLAPTAMTPARVPPGPRDAPSLEAVIGEFLVAQRATIERYREIAMAMESCDRSTQALLGEVIADEEERARNLAGLLEDAVGSQA
jgi:bacterioferritin (cytochrome b1)